MRLNAGDRVPSDGLLVDGSDVTCNESALTGESEDKVSTKMMSCVHLCVNVCLSVPCLLFSQKIFGIETFLSLSFSFFPLILLIS